MGCGSSKTDNTVQSRENEATSRNNNNNTNNKNNTNNRNNRQQQSQRGQQRPTEPKSPEPRERTPTPTPIQTNTSESARNRKNRTQPVNEKGYKKRIRENLRHATAGDDIGVLEKNMEVFENNHLEDGGDYEDAEERLEFLKTRKEIRDACMRKHPVVLEKTIQKVEASKHKRQLKPYLDRANFLLQNTEDRQKFKHNICELDQATVSEVKSYNHPPPGVHETMIATYMVIGYPEQHLTDWTEITALMSQYGNHSLVREVNQAEGKKVDPDVALKARNYLGTHTLEEIREGSNGAAAFHVWASRMVGKHEGKKGDSQGGTKQLSNSGGKGQKPGHRGDRDPNKPKTPSTPSKVPRDTVHEKKQLKEQENKAKQTKTEANNKAKTPANKELNNTQTAKNTKQTTQQVNAVANKTTKKG